MRFLLVSCLAIFALQHLIDTFARPRGLFTYLFALRPTAILHGEVWQFVTYMFLHGAPRGFGMSVLHLVLNLLGLFFFGREMEDTLGLRRFLILYFGCGVLAGLGWTLLEFFGGSPYGYCVGASGAVFGVMGAFAAIFPYRQVTLLVLYVFPVTLTARTMVLLLGCITVASLFMSDGSIAHAAHLTGGVAGYLYGRRAGRFDHRTGGSRRRFWNFFHRRPKMRVLPDEVPPSQEQVDAILDKISSRGIGSLTAEDRDLLDRASRKEE
jgi:membrane associated rhomboid family serine protease